MQYEIPFRRTYVGYAFIEADSPEDAMRKFPTMNEWEDEFCAETTSLEADGDPKPEGEHES
jgi:hypothetical protein